MADAPTSDRLPTTIPAPNYELIRADPTSPAARTELADALKNIVDVVNAFIVRKGG